MSHFSSLFKITSQCNDSCDFCLEYKFIKSKRPPLTFSEFMDNYFFLKKRHALDYFILTGGEPTLHPQFFEMLGFLKEKGESFRFITNLLKFNQNIFVRRVKSIFSNFKNQRQQDLSKIIASINDLPEKSPTAKKRFKGLEAALRAGLPLMVTTVIYNRNLKDLPRLSVRLRDLFDKFAPEKFFHLEFRQIYIEGTEQCLLDKSLVRDFSSIKKSIENSIEVLEGSRIRLTLWNFPLCYLENPDSAKNEAMAERQERRILKINKDAQMKDKEIRDWEVYLKHARKCKKCRLKKYCSGIDEAYIKKYGFPCLRSL